MALEFFPPVQGSVRGPRFCGFKHLVPHTGKAVSTWWIFCSIRNHPDVPVLPGMVFPEPYHPLLKTFASPVIHHTTTS